MDEEIEQRLRGLDDIVNEMMRKQKSKELQKEIELRLAKLNDRDPEFYSNKEPPVKLLSIKKQRTAVEEADDLLKKFMDEVKLDEKCGQENAVADHQLEERLQRLAKAQAELNLNNNNKKKANPKLKKFKQTGELIHQLMMRNVGIRVRNAADDADQNEDDQMPETDAIDWCSTCNEDAVVQCIDCDNDVYCKECFRELHRDPDMRGHRTRPYKST